MSFSRKVRIVTRWVAVLAGIGLGSAALLLLYGSKLVDQALFGAPQGSFTRILSAPLVLRAGEGWGIQGLREALLGLGLRESTAGRPAGGEFAVEAATLRLGAGVTEPSGGEVVLRATPSGLLLADAGGRPLPQVNVRAAVIGTSAPGDIVRWAVPMRAMAPVLLTAVVDIEDRSFLSHSGLSFRGLARAAIRDLLAGGVRQGGSTITQQLAKILLLRPSRTVARKVIEAWLATLLDYRFDKRTILEAYLNRVYLGQDGGWQIQGVEAASHFYFGKRAANLNVAEAALLAGLIAAPNRFDPLSHPEEARARRKAVLAAMVREGHLDPGQARSLAEALLPSRAHRLRDPHTVQFVEYLMARTRRVGDISSTLDVGLQKAVFEGCRAGMKELEARHARLRDLAGSGDPLQAAVVVLAPDGSLLALQGSRLGSAGEFNRAVSAQRQVGSLVKPFVVGTALEAGWSARSTLLDEPVEVPVGRRVWRPENNDGRYRGVVTVRDALISSLNVPMVRLGLAVSVSSVAAALRNVGLTVPSESPAILLGAVEASPLEVAGAYAVFLANGRLPGVSVERAAMTPSRPVFSPSVAREVRAILEDVPRSGTADSLNGVVSGRLAAKTGTTDERRDSWFVALRPKMVTVVWVGTDGNHEMGLFGATGALEIWRQIDVRVPEVWRQGEF
jgi:penicillin-binding protein 1B